MPKIVSILCLMLAVILNLRAQAIDAATFYAAKNSSPVPPKREFRGAWIHTVNQSRYAQMNETEMKQYFSRLLDQLHDAGINAVLFQVRPQADAWYKSAYEPWSVFITGQQGKNPGWDPLEYMVDECHKRNMDIHAWINPYRVKTKINDKTFKEPFVRKNQKKMIRFGTSLWFDPGIPENREHIVKVVKDIVRHYDIDGIHFDDYFYPYPVAGQVFSDDDSYARHAAEQGFSGRKADWRRNNVNLLVKEIHEMIRKEKPWIRFGISPFGIYRNLKQDPDGSRTNGLSNYDDLYADALLWMQEGWIDYCIPQIYWEIGHPLADYAVLLPWWNAHASKTALYIGQDIVRSTKVKQLNEKLIAARNSDRVQGNCYWPAYELTDNTGGIADTLQQNYHYYPALLPADNLDCNIHPEPVYALDLGYDYQLGQHLKWKTVRSLSQSKKASYYIVYRFLKGYEPENLHDPRNIIGITQRNYFVFPKHPYTGEWVYMVTAVNRLHQESDGERIVLRIQ